MAAKEEEQKFPLQKQEEQPGKQHIMDPIPKALYPDYRPANKLHVYSFKLWILCPQLVLSLTVFE